MGHTKGVVVPTPGCWGAWERSWLQVYGKAVYHPVPKIPVADMQFGLGQGKIIGPW